MRHKALNHTVTGLQTQDAAAPWQGCFKKALARLRRRVLGAGGPHRLCRGFRRIGGLADGGYREPARNGLGIAGSSEAREAIAAGREGLWGRFPETAMAPCQRGPAYAGEMVAAGLQTCRRGTGPADGWQESRPYFRMAAALVPWDALPFHGPCGLRRGTAQGRAFPQKPADFRALAGPARRHARATLRAWDGLLQQGLFRIAFASPGRSGCRSRSPFQPRLGTLPATNDLVFMS